MRFAISTNRELKITERMRPKYWQLPFGRRFTCNLAKKHCYEICFKIKKNTGKKTLKINRTDFEIKTQKKNLMFPTFEVSASQPNK